MELKLYEKFILLALDPQKGKFIIDALSLNYGLAGAILLELSEHNKIVVRQKKIEIIDKKYTNNAIVDASLKLINASKKYRKPRYWIYKIGNKSSGFKKIILNDLILKQILKKDTKEYLGGWIKINRYLISKVSVINDIKLKLKKIVLESDKPDLDNLLLLSLMSSCKLTRILFRDKKDHKASKKRIKELTKDIEISEAVSHTLKEIQAAILVATSSTFVGASSTY